MNQQNFVFALLSVKAKGMFCHSFSNFKFISISVFSGGSRIFPRGGGGVNTPNFPENCMKSKEFGRPGRGRASLTPPPRSANGLSKTFLKFCALNIRFLPPATKLQQSNIFTGVCQSFCSQGGGGVWQTPPGRHSPRQTPPWTDIPGQTPHQADNPLAQCMLEYTPPDPPPPAATAPDGAHPTGMHSC